MSTVKKVPKVSKPKVPKVEDQEVKEPKPRKSRAKPKPTKQEVMQMLLDGSKELKQIIQDLKDDELAIKGQSLKKVHELLQETISNLEADCKDIEEEYQELSELPENETPAE